MYFTFVVLSTIFSCMFNLFKTSTVSNVPINITPGPDPCLILDLQKQLKLQALESRFPKGKRKINFALIVDRSKSIVTDAAYNRSIQLSVDLMNFLIRTRRMYVHPDYARIAIVSFGRTLTPEFDGISSSSRATSGCEVINRIKSLYGQHIGETASFLSYAIYKTAQLFKERDLGNAENANILWIFNDGEDKSGEGAMPTLSASLVRFVVGLGQWLDDSEEANKLQSLGSDKDHVACLEAWSEILKENTPAEPEAEAERVYTESPSSDCPNTCTTGKQCVCDVILKIHSCQGDDKVTDCLDNEDCSEEPGSKQDSGENFFHTDWSIIVIVVPGIVVVGFIIGIGCWCVRRNKDNSAPPTQAPGREDLDLQPTSMPQERPPSVPIPHPTQNRGLTLPRRADPPPPVPPRSRGALVPRRDENGSRLEDYENLITEENMPGWRKYLLETSTDEKLNEIFVHTSQSSPEKRGAWTSGFKLIEHHQLQQNIEQIITSGSRQATIKACGYTYTLDQSFVSEHSFQGSRLKERSWRSHQREYIFGGLKAGYVVVVVGDEQHKDASEKVFREIQSHLQNQPNNN